MARARGPEEAEGVGVADTEEDALDGVGLFPELSSLIMSEARSA